MTTWSMTPGDWQYVFRSGLRLQVTPEGDCREATFTAQGKGVGLNPLDAVTISVDGQPVFYGEVRVGGNPYDVDGHQFTLRSLALRLKEVALPPGWSTPKQAVHLTVQALINAVLPQMGGSITVGQIDFLGFDCRAIDNASQQNPYVWLERIATDGAGMGVKVRFGVNANKEFFCVKAKEDEMALTNDMLTGQTRWVAPVAESPCTAVLWYVARKPDGEWLTYLSQAPEVARYGLRVKPLIITVADLPVVWVRVGMNLTSNTDENVRNLILRGFSETAASAQDAYDLLTDGVTDVSTPKATAFVTTMDAKKKADDLYLSASMSGVDRFTVAALNGFQKTTGDLKTSNAALSLDGQVVTTIPNGGGYVYYGSPANAKLSLDLAQRPTVDDWNAFLTVMEFRAERLNRGLLDQLACYHYNIPATAPADIELWGFSGNRAGRVTLNGWQSPVDAWEYRITAARGITTGILAGQPDDPVKLAQAALIKARDNHAVIHALTAGGS